MFGVFPLGYFLTHTSLLSGKKIGYYKYKVIEESIAIPDDLPLISQNHFRRFGWHSTGYSVVFMYNVCISFFYGFDRGFEV